MSKLHHLGKRSPDKLNQFQTFPEFERKFYNRAVNLHFTYPEDYLEERCGTTKNQSFRLSMINYWILSEYFLSRLPRLHDGSRLELFERIFCRNQIHNIFHFSSFRTIGFQWSAKNAFYMSREKV